MFDAIEVFNGEAIFGNKSARRFYSEQKPTHPSLGAISSSDGHSFYEIGTSWTEIEFPNLENGFLESLRKSIRATNLETNAKNHQSYLGTFDHAMDMMVRDLVLRRIGIKF